MQKLLAFLLQQLFPFRCLLCNLLSDRARDLCSECEKDLPWLHDPCQLCGEELMTSALICGECLSRPPPYDEFVAAIKYDGAVVSLIKQLKFNEKSVVAEVLGKVLAKKIALMYAGSNLPEILIPTPLHKKRLQERGFNQALEIARVLSRNLNIGVDRRCVIRQKLTSPQTSLDVHERLKNVRNAFCCPRPLQYQFVAIVDDVSTTGSTVKELSKTLTKNGVKKIAVWCLAKTQQNST